MLLVDVNVLVYAHRADAANHPAYKGWLEDMIESEPVFGMADLVLSGFLRLDRVRERMDHDRPRLQPLSETSMATPLQS